MSLQYKQPIYLNHMTATKPYPYVYNMLKRAVVDIVKS